MSTNSLCNGCQRNVGTCSLNLQGFPHRTMCISVLRAVETKKQTKFVAHDKDKVCIYYAELP